MDHLKSFSITKEMSKLYFEVLKDMFGNEEENKKIRLAEIDTLMSKAEERLNNLEDDLADRKITHEQYQKSAKRYEDQLSELKDQQEGLTLAQSEFDEYLKFGVVLLSNIEELYRKSDVCDKQSIIGSIFPEGLTFSEKNYRTTRLNEFVSLICTAIKGYEWDEKKKATKNGGFSSVAPSPGLEPGTP